MNCPLGQALSQPGIEHIPSYCPQWRGRVERVSGARQGRFPQKLGRAGLTTLAAANFTGY
jgi:hypothetical protein